MEDSSGEYPELAAKGMKNTGSENYGGPIVTAGGLVFIAATLYDNKFRAFDKATGKLVWETTLPFAGQCDARHLRGQRASIHRRRRHEQRTTLADAAECGFRAGWRKLRRIRAP